MRAHILNFQSPKALEELEEIYENGYQTNLEYLFEGLVEGYVEWTISKNIQIGDMALFMCAKTSIDHMSRLVKQAGDSKDNDFKIFLSHLHAYFKKYAGNIIAIGKVDEYLAELGDLDTHPNLMYAKIVDLKYLEPMIHISEFNDFIFINRFGAITTLKNEHWIKLKEKLSNKNTEIVSVSKLESIGEKVDNYTIVPRVPIITFQHQRDSRIIHATKKRAKGVCQLCGMFAPFSDKDGHPFLEVHHIIWLSKGGTDSIDNTVALCPNCHRKMHVLNDPDDIKKTY